MPGHAYRKDLRTRPWPAFKYILYTSHLIYCILHIIRTATYPLNVYLEIFARLTYDKLTTPYEDGHNAR